jgi:hypothetical protein
MEDDTVKNISQQKTSLHDSFITFLRTHTVYETVPENMKVNKILTIDPRIQHRVIN